MNNLTIEAPQRGMVRYMKNCKRIPATPITLTERMEHYDCNGENVPADGTVKLGNDGPVPECDNCHKPFEVTTLRTGKYE